MNFEYVTPGINIFRVQLKLFKKYKIFYELFYFYFQFIGS